VILRDVWDFRQPGTTKAGEKAHDEGRKGNPRKSAFSEGDELGNALHIAHCDEAGPEDREDVVGTAPNRSVLRLDAHEDAEDDEEPRIV
jgi:hypothetical protein